MKLKHTLSASLMLLPWACAPLGAQQSQPSFEVTPFAGMRFGGDFNLKEPFSGKLDLDAAGTYGLAFNLRIDEVSQYEIFWGHQSTNLDRDVLLGSVDIDVDYLHIGGTVETPMETQRRVIPYFVGGLGATRFNLDASEARDKTRFSLSLGGGVKVPFNERFALRLEARGYLTFIDTDTSFFCRSDDGDASCRIQGSGSTFLQYELLAGAAFAF